MLRTRMQWTRAAAALLLGLAAGLGGSGWATESVDIPVAEAAMVAAAASSKEAIDVNKLAADETRSGSTTNAKSAVAIRSDGSRGPGPKAIQPSQRDAQMVAVQAGMAPPAQGCTSCRPYRFLGVGF